MVWSDQTQFPFYVIDNNGNIILTIDQSGLHLVGPAGRWDALVDAASAQPTFWFSAPTNMTPGVNTSSFINAPNNNSIGLNSQRYTVPLPVGTQTRYMRTFIRPSFHTSEVVGTAQQVVGGQSMLQDGSAALRLFNSNNTLLGRLTIQQTGTTVAGTTADTILTCVGSIWFYAEGAPPTTAIRYDSGTNRFLVDIGAGFSWTQPTYQNGWHALGGTYGLPGFGLTVEGNVRMAGILIGGTLTDGTVICNLPTWARPPVDKIVMVTNVSSGTWPGSPAQIRIRTNGNVEIWAMSTTTNGAHSWDNCGYQMY